MLDFGRLTETFLDLVRIDSLSFRERAVGDYVLGTLNTLRIDCREDGAAGKVSGDCGNIIARLPGNAPGQAILFAAHLDTVGPSLGIEPVIKQGVIRSAGRTVLGADDKMGITAILEVIRTIQEKGLKHPPLTAVFTVAEERGLLGARALDIRRIRADVGFILDEGGPVGKIIVKAPYQDFLACEFTGRAAHAGVEPEKGRSAVAAAARAITGMKLGRLDKETTANIGVIDGGTAINVVPEQARIEGEARSLSTKKLARQISGMSDACAKAASAEKVKQKTTVRRLYDGFDLRSNHPAVVTAVAAIRATGKRPRLSSSGGGSDTNVFNARGIPAVNLSVGYERVHSINEYLPLREMEAAARMTLALAANTRPPAGAR
ncbi:MAG: M20/M25/M40 family metallo-hydrolase [Actinomycetota bacterium]